MSEYIALVVDDEPDLRAKPIHMSITNKMESGQQERR